MTIMCSRRSPVLGNGLFYVGWLDISGASCNSTHLHNAIASCEMQNLGQLSCPMTKSMMSMFLHLFIATSYTSCLEMLETCTHQHVSGMPLKLLKLHSLRRSTFELCFIYTSLTIVIFLSSLFYQTKKHNIL